MQGNILTIVENPQMFFQDMTTEISFVKAIFSGASSIWSSSDPIPTFVFISCPELLALLVNQLFNTIIKSKQWTDLRQCSTIKPKLKSGYPEIVEKYRPINNLPQLSIFLEKTVFRSVYPQIRPSILTKSIIF